MVTQVPSGGLTSVEQALIDHVACGEWLDVAADDEVIDEAAMRSWGDSRTCRAAVIRDILRGKATDCDPHGLRLRGARITGRIDLENLTTDINLELKDCLLEEGVLARDAHLAFLGLAGCQIEHPAEPPLDGARLTCGVLNLSRARVIGHANSGAVNLAGAHIGGGLGCDGAKLCNDSGPALVADGLQVDQAVYLRGGFAATGSGGAGAVNLVAARIGSLLDCSGAELRNDSGPALVADGLQVGQAVYLRGGFAATGSGGAGAVNLVAARISGSLECDGAELCNDSGPALVADGLQVGRAMFLRGGFTATGSGSLGAMRLVGAHVGVQLSCTGASLRNDSGPALVADGLQADGDVSLNEGFEATGSGSLGAVRLLGAHVGGNLDCSNAVLLNGSGPALGADTLQTDQSMVLRGSKATGSGNLGTVRLVGAHIRGQLSFAKAELRNDSGPALMADSLQVDQTMFLTGGFTGGGEAAAVDLTDARVGGTFQFAPEPLEHMGDSHRRLTVDGLTYTGVPQLISAQGWRELFRDGTSEFAAQPYQQLAAGYRALGDDRQARQTLIAQRDDQLARADTHRSERVWGKITKVTLGYGYKPWRALLFLAAVVAVSCVLAIVLGSHGALKTTDKAAHQGQPCTWVQKLSVGMDLNLPVGTSAARAKCDLTKNSASTTATWLTVTDWALQILAWAFAALFVAGFTSAVRKT